MSHIYEIDQIVVDLPTWALSAIVNGDESGLSDYELELLQEFYYTTPNPIVWVDAEEQPFFSKAPEFGLPCECVRAHIFYHFHHV